MIAGWVADAEHLPPAVIGVLAFAAAALAYLVYVGFKIERVDSARVSDRKPRSRIAESDQHLREIRQYVASLISQPDVPAHLQDLKQLSNAQLKSAVAKLSKEMREYAARSGEGQFRSLLPGTQYDVLTDADPVASRNRREAAYFREHVERTAGFNSDYRPRAIALWEELRRRGATGKYIRSGDLDAIEYGSLAGPSPIEDAATGLETLARELED